MDTRKGGHRYCPSCKKIVETRVLLEGYCQTDFHGVPAKQRQIICGTDAEGSNGCGTRWFTLEILEEQVLGKAGKKGLIVTSRTFQNSFLLFYLPYPNVLRAIETATWNVAESATVRGDQISIPLLLRSS
jgi:hypothetical protein